MTRRLPNVHPGEILLEEFLRAPWNQPEPAGARRQGTASPGQRDRPWEACDHAGHGPPVRALLRNVGALLAGFAVGLRPRGGAKGRWRGDPEGSASHRPGRLKTDPDGVERSFRNRCAIPFSAILGSVSHHLLGRHPFDLAGIPRSLPALRLVEPKRLDLSLGQLVQAPEENLREPGPGRVGPASRLRSPTRSASWHSSLPAAGSSSPGAVARREPPATHHGSTALRCSLSTGGNQPHDRPAREVDPPDGTNPRSGLEDEAG